MARKSTAEIKRLLKETTNMKGAEAAKHLGISAATLYKWKEKAKSTKATTAAKTPVISKRVINLVKSLKERIAKLEKELV